MSGVRNKQEALLAVTVFIRYQLDPFKRAMFETYARRWLTIIPKCGGNLLGYWMPHEGTNNIAFALISFDKRAAFHKLHESGCFVLPNPWDVGSARALQQLGFKAIASTSAGYAWSIARADTHVTVDDVCEHLTALCKAVDLPVNADFEGGFAHKPEKVAANVARAVKTGVAGLSIEDSTGDAAKKL